MPDTPGHSLIRRAPSVPTSRFCSCCGLTLAELRQQSRVGCAACYDAFADLLAQSIERLHDATEHPNGSVSTSLLRSYVGDRRPFESASLEVDRLHWLCGEGEAVDVILSSRVRLARNLADADFAAAWLALGPGGRCVWLGVALAFGWALPVLGVSRETSPDDMAARLHEGRLDILGFARPSIADPFHEQRWDYTTTERTNRRGTTHVKTFTVFFEGDALTRWEGEYFPENDAQLSKDVRKFGPNLAKDKKKGSRR